MPIGDVLTGVAAPMIDRIFASFLLELLICPGLYQFWGWHFDPNRRTSKKERRTIVDLA